MNARPGRIVGTRACAAAFAAALAASPIAAWPVDAADGSGLGLRPEGLIEALRANGAHVMTLGTRGGLDGYFVTPSESGGYSLYVTGDGHAVVGLLYGPDGREVTGVQLAAARIGEAGGITAGTGAREAEPTAGGTAAADRRDTTGAAVTAHAAEDVSSASSSPSSRFALFERSAAAFGFTLGERGPLVVLLGDAACPWSRSAVAQLGRGALAGRLQLRVVPVAVLGAAAARDAAAIASHPDPARAWFEGPEHPADRTGAERIARNNALLDEWSAVAVPLIVWRAPDGGVRHRIGDIDDVDEWLRETLGPYAAGPETFVPYTLRVGDTRAVHPQGGRRP